MPYAAQSASQIGVDSVTLYTAGNGSLVPLTKTLNLSGLNTAAGTAALTFASDAAVMVRDQTKQVFVLLQYHFGT